MTAIYLSPDRVTLRSYSASVKGPRAIVKIEIDVADPGYLGFLLEDLGRLEAEQRRSAAAKKTARSRPLLALPDLRGRS